MTEKEILQTARALLVAGFCQHTYARDADGKEVDWSDANATQFCAIGALYRAMPLGENFTLLRQRLFTAASGLFPNFVLLDVNDDFEGRFEGGLPAVLQVYDVAIAEVENEIA